jgi:2-isopropylmalate synthase
MAERRGRRVRIFDTTLRDGEQTPGAALTVDEKVQVARQLARLKVDVIEAGFPAASPGEMTAVRRIASEVGAARGTSAIAALARCVPDDVAAAGEALAPARKKQLHVFIATSDIHVVHKLRTTREEVIRRIASCVGQARALVGEGQDVEFSAEDASRTEPDFLFEAFETAVAAGASVLNVPDTVGYAEPKEFGALAREVVRRFGRRAVISVHCHNDLGLATANTLAAIQAGVRQVEVTVNGLGERAGNASMEEVVMTLRTRPARYRNAWTGVATEQITATSRLVSYLTGITVQPNKSVVGANAFAHESGIHQDGILKNPLTYEILTPQSVGLAGSMITLGKLSGRRGFIERLRRLGIELEPMALEALYGEAIALADRKKQVTDADLLALAEQRADPVPTLVRLEHWAAASRQGESSSGNVSLFFDGRTYRAYAGGNGPVDALLKAVDNALEQIIGGRPALVDYQLRSVGSGEDAQGEATVKIEHGPAAEDGEAARTYTGHGLSTNVVEASLRAYLAAVNKLIAHHEADRTADRAGTSTASTDAEAPRRPRAIPVEREPSSLPVSGSSSSSRTVPAGAKR